MAVGKSSSVRMGPVNIFALIIVICLAVMAVLALSTANASKTEAQKQADFTTGTYASETSGQEFVAQVDGVLAQTANQGGTVSQALETLRGILPEETVYTDNSVSVGYISADGRKLTVTMQINDDLSYQITQWKVSTEWTQEPTGQLWSGE